MKLYYLILVVLIVDSCTPLLHQNLKEISYKQKGNNVYLKKGVIEIDESIVINDNLNLIGDNTTIKCKSDFSIPFIKINNNKNISISNVTFLNGKLENSSDKSYLERMNILYGIEIFNSSNIKIDNCHFENFKGTAIKVLDCDEIKITNSKFKNIGLSSYKGVEYSYDGIYLGGYNKISNVVIDKCDFENIGSLFPYGYLPWPNDGDGVHILTAGLAQNILVQNCKFLNCTARGVKVQSGNNIQLLNNNFTSCGSAVILTMNKDIDGVVIKDNNVTKCNYAFGTDALYGNHNVSNLLIQSNKVDSCEHFLRTSGQSNIHNSEISNNTVDKLGTFFIVGRLINTKVLNNRVKKYATINDPSYNMAIYISPESDMLEIRDNIFGKSKNTNAYITNMSKNRIVIQNNKEKIE